MTNFKGFRILKTAFIYTEIGLVFILSVVFFVKTSKIMSFVLPDWVHPQSDITLFNSVHILSLCAASLFCILTFLGTIQTA